jgi:hypothetical protein
MADDDKVAKTQDEEEARRSKNDFFLLDHTRSSRNLAGCVLWMCTISNMKIIDFVADLACAFSC